MAGGCRAHLVAGGCSGRVVRPCVCGGGQHALEALSDALRQEMALFRVSVSVLQPAYVQSEIFGKVP